MQGQEGIPGSSDHRLALIHEMSAHNFDLIRFASYRTATKLRFIQKKVSLHAVDIWNVIEAFREQGLHALEPSSELSVARLETLLCSLYHSLNKRAPPTQQAHVDVCSSLLLNWLLAAYATVDNVGKIRVFSIKIALATLCAGKLMDKLRYVFSQISDTNGLLIQWRFNEYLQEVLALPAAVYESPTFSYTDTLAASIFNPNIKVTVNDFLDTMMSDPGPPCLVWLPLVHRIASVENVIHPVQCDACQRENFSGFRYRCQKCPHYTLCQDCFWRGRVSPPHNLDHQVKEYATFSPTKTIGQSLRKSFRCVPDKQRNNLPRFPEQPEKTLNLSHIVPPSPIPSHNGFPDGQYTGGFDGMGSLDSRSTARSLDSARDDEHRLIARYAAKLAQEARGGMPRDATYRKNSLSPDIIGGRVPSEACLGMDSTRAQRELINQLESKNREIMREIARRQQELESSGHSADNPVLMSELRALRMRKDELETHLITLQDSRRQLMIQLEGLMKMLKNHQSSPRSTPNSSPRSTKSPPLPPGVAPSTQTNPRSAPQTPMGMPPSSSSSMTNSMPPMSVEREKLDRERDRRDMPLGLVQPLGGMVGRNDAVVMMQQQQQQERNDREINRHNVNNDASLIGVGGDVRNAFGGGPGMIGSNGNGTPGSTGRSLRNDLLVAADSVTNAMSTLVRELNSDFEDDGDDESDVGWQQELQRRYMQDANFMAELRARHPSSPPEVNHVSNSSSQNYIHGQNFKMQGIHFPNSQSGSLNQHGYVQLDQNQDLFGPQYSTLDNHLNQDRQQIENCDEDTEHQEVRNKETIEFEEALKQWVNR
ncbi:dystrobrevin beta-like isoform X3 [Sitophilus oryzae]|uniref:Dystrobrevin beta-like isoform X3 n=1 Tax=Sitophilus oryzae TaxID=7048 RepID=A0A6J2YN28_SITOR|nr:dystrobrevin beta-like isoform X3 [Sitophilus oryzae]